MNTFRPTLDPEANQGVIITDCNDANARARQLLRFSSFFGFTPSFIGLGIEHPDLEAAGHLVDVLDAAQKPADYFGKPRTVVLVNVAPRGDDVRDKWENGTPFCHTEVGNTTIVSTYEGRALSLVSKLGLAGTAHLLDIPKVTSFLSRHDAFTSEQAQAINNTQFRSLEFLPLAAFELVNHASLPAETHGIDKHPLVDGRAWFIDNFGNIKTTVLPEEINFEEGKTVTVGGTEKAACYSRLADVPTGELGVTIGSSGFGQQRWLEVVQQRGRAADELDIKVGTKVLEVC